MSPRALLLLAALAAVASAASLPRLQRSAQAPSATTLAPDNETICKDTTPCGWAVYTPFIRRVDYFIKNACLCPQGLSCMRASDDLSVSAYVYTCLLPRPSAPATS